MSTKLLIALVLFPLFYAFYSWRLRSHGEQNTAWARQMKATPWRDRRRIAQAVRQRKRLDNPREAGTALIVLGVLAWMWTVVALGALFVALGVAERVRTKRLRQRMEQAVQLNREQASLEAAGD